MSEQRIVPCMWFDDAAEKAAGFYFEAFGGRVVGRSRYPSSGDNPAGRPPGSVLTVEVELAGFRMTLLNGGPMFKPNPSLSFFVHADSVDDAERRWAALARDGQALMPLGSYPWSERYGWVQDRFGVSWQVIAGRRPPGGATIEPCLMFAGAVHGRAAEALAAWAAVLGGKVEKLEPYAEGEGPSGTIKHGRATLAGQALLAMDSHLAHGFGFDEGASLQVMCRDQAEVDRVWRELGEGGREGPCGWLTDRFGLSWQVVPSAITKWLTSDDVAACDRAFAAVMGMGKLDLAAIEAAFTGA